MNAITPLARAVLDALDTCERGAGDTEIYADLEFVGDCDLWYDHDELLQTLVQMIDAGLIVARIADWPLDMGVTADPILYEITDAGCAARWALLKAERAHAFARPVYFPTRDELVAFCRGVGI